MAWAQHAARAIWLDLCDRSGFGLGCLKSEDPELYAEIQADHADIIRREAEAAREEGNASESD